MSFSCDCDDREDEDSLPEYETAPDLALAALLTLMTSYPDHPTPAIARAIIAHLQVVSRDERHDKELSRSAAQLVSKWEALEVLCAKEAGVHPVLPVRH
ncbi:hypothetical protein [Zoogloea sp.]|uniref:hypothetical protein n=1 Tax=Zoogloea sp. TaxID=49181 RepID=UPI0025910414|nr:hypothetical protein [Zoogloea sp.]MDD2667118.1 hypothetical protein [Zoogloea sp.]